MATKSTSAALATTFTTSAAPVSSQFSQVLQPRLPSTTTITSNLVILPAAVISLSGFTREKQEKFMKFERCFKCKQEGHMLPDCTQPFRLYLAVSALLQEVTLVEDKVASALENE